MTTTPKTTPKSILFTIDSSGNKSSGIDYLTGECLPLDLCDRIFTDVHFGFKEGKITPLGVDGTLSTYLIEIL